jgi:hypothetical protein
MPRITGNPCDCQTLMLKTSVQTDWPIISSYTEVRLYKTLGPEVRFWDMCPGRDDLTSSTIARIRLLRTRVPAAKHSARLAVDDFATDRRANIAKASSKDARYSALSDTGSSDQLLGWNCAGPLAPAAGVEQKPERFALHRLTFRSGASGARPLVARRILGSTGGKLGVPPLGIMGKFG